MRVWVIISFQMISPAVDAVKSWWLFDCLLLGQQLKGRDILFADASRWEREMTKKWNDVEDQVSNLLKTFSFYNPFGSKGLKSHTIVSFIKHFITTRILKNFSLMFSCHCLFNSNIHLWWKSWNSSLFTSSTVADVICVLCIHSFFLILFDLFLWQFCLRFCCCFYCRFPTISFVVMYVSLPER